MKGQEVCSSLHIIHGLNYPVVARKVISKLEGYVASSTVGLLCIALPLTSMIAGGLKLDWQECVVRLPQPCSA